MRTPTPVPLHSPVFVCAMSPSPTAEYQAIKRMRAWWLDSLLIAAATVLAELALHYAVELGSGTLPPVLRGLVNAVGLAIIIGPLFAWTIYRRHVDAKLAFVATGTFRVPGSPHRRVRFAILGAFAVVTLIVSGAFWGHLRTAHGMQHTAEVLNLAGRQRLHSQHVHRLVAMPDQRHLADSLDAVASRIRREADRLTLLTGPDHGVDLAGTPASVDTIRRAERARDTLLSAIAAWQGASSDSARAVHAAQLRRAADTLLVRSEALVAQLQRYEESHVRRSIDAAWWLFALLLATLVGAAALVVEPVVRLLARQHSAMSDRSVEFQRLAMVAQRTSNSVVIADAERRIIWVNDGFTRLTGYALHEVAGKVPGPLLQCDATDPATVQAMRASLKASASYRGAILNQRKSGEHYWVDLSIEPLYERGELTGYLAINSDITEQMQAREAVRAERDRIDLIVQSAALGTWEWDLDTERVIFNRRFAEMLGYDLDEIRPHASSWRDLAHPDDRALALTSLVEHLEGRAPEYRCEQRYRRKDGSYASVLAVGRVTQRALDGRPLRAVGVHIDLTAQHEAREALERTKAQLEEAQQIARLGNWSFDVATDTMEWSHEIFQLFGRKAEQGAPNFMQMLRDFTHAEGARLRDAVNEGLRRGKPFSLALRTVGRNPDVRVVRVEGRARRGDDERVCALFGTVMDVTDAVERVEALREAQARAETANRAKSEFLANMSHEIRTPLTAILGFTDVLRDDAVRQQATPDQLQAMDTISRAGEHLLSVINDILDLSKIEAGHMSVEKVSTPLPNVLLEVESLMRARAAAKGVTLETRVLTPVPDRIVTDPTRLRQILMNLVGNAAKFTDRGRVLVETGVEQVETRDGSHEMLVIAVDDTGPGMTDEQVAQLFRPFSQADSSVTRRHGGTGLGLTISRRLAELMGGDVELVQTAIGRGSRFELRLPLASAPDAVRVTTLESAPVTSATPTPAVGRTLLSGRVLLAEDGEDNQRLIALLLRSAGADVTIVANGRIALEAVDWADAAGAPFDLLITDMQMPEMDGYTLASTLRARGATVPIVALTAHAMSDDRQKCLDAGCDDYASKPINRQALIATCARWMHPQGDVFPSAVPADAPLSVAAQGDASSDGDVHRSELHDDPELGALARQFARALPARVDAIMTCLIADDRDGAGRLAHQLKGAAGGYGYPLVSEIARELEQQLRDHGTGALGDAEHGIAERLQMLAAAVLRGVDDGALETVQIVGEARR
jgi:PAS domain S-box-containing protein